MDREIALSEQTEKEKNDNYPMIRSFEEDTARYWQMVFGFEQMGTRTENEHHKKLFKILIQKAIDEYIFTIKEKIDAVMPKKEEEIKAVKELDEKRINWKAEPLRKLFEEY